MPHLGPAAYEDCIRFRVNDPHRSYAGVRLWQQIGITGDRLEFAPIKEGWVLRLPRPPVDRLEYLIEYRHVDGSTSMVPDPHNPARVRGAFGEHSVLELPGYAAPWWLNAVPAPGRKSTFTVRSHGLAAPVELTVWEPPDAQPDEPLPLLVAHDGPEYDALGGLTRYAGAVMDAGLVPRHRMALLSPGHRDAWYSASPAYAWTLARVVLPAVRAETQVAGPVVALGASLGGLAALHAEYLFPGTFAGLCLQSGSFFHPRFDAHEVRFRRYLRIVGFVTGVLAAPAATPYRPVLAITCGSAEENLANNRLFVTRMREQGYDVRLGEIADAHNYTAWRDMWDPHLTDLLSRLWS